jgi:type VI protein secretion system component Hcp
MRMDHHDQDEPQTEAVAAVESAQSRDAELTDEDLDGVAGGDFSFTKPVDKPTPILF